MRVIVTGGTGFIGAPLCRRLAEAGHEVLAVTRKDGASGAGGAPRPDGVSRLIAWSDLGKKPPGSLISPGTALINLAGSPIAAKPWNVAAKREIQESRVASGNALVNAVKSAGVIPSVIIQGSAVGFYGNRGDERLTEESGRGTGFLSDVCARWEASTSGLRDLGVRHVTARIGLVLDHGGGVLEKMMTPFRLFAGGPVGSGRQWMAWIHREDLVEAILFLMAGERHEGIFNLASPEPLTMHDFAAKLGKVMGRPSLMRVPPAAVRAVFGEMGEETILASQRVYPEKLSASGFTFRYPAIERALEAIIHGGKKAR
ncbi:MAG: TIGR01777 family oxidoreductase [Candidatus Eremiobacteraeota bacterium]|nr:TIGR01777 family oxidoreductase [Candidatus Eremiobacteraeota bacterium]